jgi:hypothetical protein
MNKVRFICSFALLIIFLVLILPACSQAKVVPDPETVSGVYVHAGYEYYYWEEGLRVMIWHDGIHHQSCSSITNGHYEIECLGETISKHTFTWRLGTEDGKTAHFTIDDHPFDLNAGNLFIIQSSSGHTEVKQIMRDLSAIQATAGRVTEFGLSDPIILEFTQLTLENDKFLPEVESAQQTLISFFSYLHDGEYKQASALYGGMYHSLRDLNPRIDPDDHSALFKNVCTVNGAQCLEVLQATLLEQPSPSEFRFIVQFSNEDGSLYSRGPCCGEDSPNNIAQTEFIYTVRLACTGNYQVLELPVFGP